MKAKPVALITLGVLAICALVYAQTTNSNYGAQGGLNWVVGGVMTRSGTGHDLISTRVDVDVTTDTAHFSAANRGYVTLHAYSALTAVHPTGGTLGQRIECLSGNESSAYTMTFSDSATIQLGGDIVLTPTQKDILCLECTNADGAQWRLVYNHDN